METSLNLQENQNPFIIPSPNTHSTNTSTKPDPNNPYPTTFVQADTTTFKQVVQILTGTSETARIAAAGGLTRPDPVKNPIPPIKSGTKKEKASKLYERRNSLKNFMISPLIPGFENYSGSPRKPKTPEILSPSMLKFPGLVLSPVTPLLPDPFNRSPHSNVGIIDMEAENKAIAHKGFYLHPSPTSMSEPRLLPLFPVTSPKVSGSSNSS